MVCLPRHAPANLPCFRNRASAASERLYDLSTDNDIGDVGVAAIAEALQEHPSLRFLNIEYNNISDEGARALAEALGHNGQLQTLWLFSNDIGADGAWALSEALQVNSSLQNLDLDGENRELYSSDDDTCSCHQ